MAIAIDKRVLSSVNAFEEVSRNDTADLCGFQFGPNAFKPILQTSSMDADMKEANFKRIMGTGEATWFAPSSANSHLPYADILAARVLSENLLSLEHVWQARLCRPRMAYRLATSTQWYIGVGQLCEVIVKLWPATVIGNEFHPQLTPGTRAETFTFHDPNLWVARPIEPVAPMRRAVQLESQAGGAMLIGDLCDLDDSAKYGRLEVVAFAFEPERPMLQAAVREGCWDLPPSFLLRLCKFYDCTIIGHLIFDLLYSLARGLIPADQLTDDLLDKIFAKRSAAFEYDEDYESIIELEFVLEAFDKSDRSALESEIKSARTLKQDRDTFEKQRCDWKVQNGLGRTSLLTT